MFIKWIWLCTKFYFASRRSIISGRLVRVGVSNIMDQYIYYRFLDDQDGGFRCWDLATEQWQFHPREDESYR